MEAIYARIERWAFVRLKEPSRSATIHIVGYILEHKRLIEDFAQPYIGSSLREIDLAHSVCRNRRGRRIALVGDPLAPGELPGDICAMLERAAEEWNVHDDATWERVELTEAAIDET